MWLLGVIFWRVVTFGSNLRNTYLWYHQNFISYMLLQIFVDIDTVGIQWPPLRYIGMDGKAPVLRLDLCMWRILSFQVTLYAGIVFSSNLFISTKKIMLIRFLLLKKKIFWSCFIAFQTAHFPKSSQIMTHILYKWWTRRTNEMTLERR